MWRDDGRGPVDNERRRRRQRRNSLLSSVFFLACAAVLVAIAYLYVQDQREPDPPERPPRPTAQAGDNELIDVIEALRAEGLTVEIARQNGKSPDLSPPGQALAIGDARGYVFIYPGVEGVANREEEFGALDQDAFALLTTRGTPIVADPTTAHFAAASNVLLVLDGASADAIAKADAAVEALA